jgi:dolichol-phosphate mannosyltransferase
MTTPQNKIYIVMLAYNEQGVLADVLADVGQAARGLGRSFEVVLVDDGSKDKTAAIAAEYQSRMPLTLLRHPVNLGVGRAFDTGLRDVCGRAAPGDYVITMESDRTCSTDRFRPMVELLDGGLDVVCASRSIAGGAYVNCPLVRWVCSVGANWLMRLLYRIPGVTDYTIFYRAYRTEPLRKTIDSYGSRFIESPGFSANAEILLKMSRTVPIACGEVPFVHQWDVTKRTSHLRTAKTIAEYGHLFKSLAHRS